MTPEIFSEWLLRQGHQVVRTASSFWHSEGMHVYQAFPYHWLIQPSAQELQELTFHHRALALRYSTAGESNHPDASYHVVFTEPSYELERLSSWARKNVRRGLRSCNIMRISFDRYIEEGWPLRLDTLARQHRKLQETQEDWRRKNQAAVDLDGFEIWAAEVDGKLAATLLTFQMDHWGYMIYQQCHRDFLREHVNNALSFAVTRDLICRPEIHGVFYGMRSLDAPASVDEFKFRMGYEEKPVRQQVVFHPYFSPFVNSFTLRMLQGAHTLIPQHRLLAKAQGMFRLAITTKESCSESEPASLRTPA